MSSSSWFFSGWTASQSSFPTVNDPQLTSKAVGVKSPSSNSSNSGSTPSSDVSPGKSPNDVVNETSKSSSSPAVGDRSMPIILRGSNQNSEEIIKKVNEECKVNGFKWGPEKGGEHCFCSLDTSTFKVRGPKYLDDKVKVDGNPAVFDLMQVELFRCNQKIVNVAGRPDSWLHGARKVGDKRYYLVVVYITPSPPHIHVAMYYAVQPDTLRGIPNGAKIWEQFTAHGSWADDFRRERWKVIPRISEGSWIVQKTVGTTPALLAQKLTHHFIICDGTLTGEQLRGSKFTRGVDAAGGSNEDSRERGGSFNISGGPGPYLEADCDVGSSSAALVLIGMLQSYAKQIVIDLGFTVEAREDETLPETIVGGIRLHRVDVFKAPLLEPTPDDWILGNPPDNVRRE